MNVGYVSNGHVGQAVTVDSKGPARWNEARMSARDNAVKLARLLCRADEDSRSAVIRFARDGAVLSASDGFIALDGKLALRFR
jgi:hypothetical protein